MPCLLPVMKRNAQNSADLWFARAQFHPLYLLSRHDVAHVTSHTRPSRFSACNIESWVGPGDKARLWSRCWCRLPSLIILTLCLLNCHRIWENPWYEKLPPDLGKPLVWDQCAIHAMHIFGALVQKLSRSRFCHIHITNLSSVSAVYGGYA